jgi:hypothetical protein
MRLPEKELVVLLARVVVLPLLTVLVVAVVLLGCEVVLSSLLWPDDGWGLKHPPPVQVTKPTR